MTSESAEDRPTTPLSAISPLDGRYHETVAPLAGIFSEYGLIKARCLVEIRFLLALDQTSLFPSLSGEERMRVENFMNSFSEEQARRIKDIERETRHDVKAVEYHLRNELKLTNNNMIHFGLTSEDVNNLAYSTIFSDFVKDFQIPLIRNVFKRLIDLVKTGKNIPFPTRTHGQLASPSTAGKEIAVFLLRLHRLFQRLDKQTFRGKCSGATGGFSAWLAAFPDYDWFSFSRKFVESFGFEWNPLSTQIEDHDSWAEYFDLCRHMNNVLIDLDIDMWLYLMQGWYVEQPRENEIGSSTMPHKVNPIRFENSEGNLQISNALLSFLSDKLTKSRMQRDLSDSTVSRNIGVALSHSFLGMTETIRGLERVRLNPDAARNELRKHPTLLSEPMQTILRTIPGNDPYDLLKKLTRGKAITDEEVSRFIRELPVPEETKIRLSELRPDEYLGLSASLCEHALALVEPEVNE